MRSMGEGTAAGAEDFSPTKRLAEWGSGTKCRGGAVRRTAGNPRWGSWLASLAPPPRLRRCSPVPLPLHGGEVLDGPAAGAEDFSPTKRLAEWGSGTKCRGGAVRRTAGNPRWFSGSLRSRPLPASGGTPPFRCRSTGERCWTALPLEQRTSPPRSGQRSGGVARSAEGARSAGPQGNHGGFLARFARAPSPPPAVLPRSAAAPRGRSPDAQVPGAKY